MRVRCPAAGGGKRRGSPSRVTRASTEGGDAGGRRLPRSWEALPARRPLVTLVARALRVRAHEPRGEPVPSPSRRRAAAAAAVVLAAGLVSADAQAAIGSASGGPFARRHDVVRSSLGRPTDPRDRASLVRYQSSATAWPTPEGHFLVHYVADDADPDAPDLTDAVDYAGDPVPDGVPDYVEEAGADAERAYAVEVGRMGYRPPPPDDGDGV